MTMEQSLETAGAGPVAGAAPLLPFETWVALAARLVNVGMEERLDILDHREVPVEDWLRSDEHHCLALAADIAAGRMERAERYGRACAAELERRRTGAPDVPPADAKPAAAVDAIEEPPATTTPAIGAPAVAETAPLPSFLHYLPPPVALPLPTPVALPLPTTRTPSPLAGTMAAMELPSFVKAATNALPFGDTPTPDFLASIDAERPGPSNAAGATIGVGVDLLAQVQHTLPFAKADADGAKPGAQAARFPRLPLETYASLCAELSVFPERTPGILQKYGVKDEAARQALGKDWDARLSANADTREEWQRLCDTYAEYLRKGGR
jgi:hypothetical protein